MTEQEYELVKRRDRHIAALLEYVGRLEEELREARGDNAHWGAREDAQATIADLRYQCGLRTDGRLRD